MTGCEVDVIGHPLEGWLKSLNHHNKPHPAINKVMTTTISSVATGLK